AAVLAFMTAGCGRLSTEPIFDIKKNLSNVPSYSILLEDMKQKGNFFKDYFHKYRVVQENDSNVTGWMEVSKDFYRQNENFLGMVLAGRVDGKDIATAAPPGYQYLGNPTYGRWVSDGRGGSFWEFYGKYSLMRDCFGGWYGPSISRGSYKKYRGYHSRKKPYFGLNNKYGSSGSIVKKTRPDFFRRSQVTSASKKSSFSDKVSKRIGRKRTSMRSRSGGKGK
ncbi:hypothetical protein QUF76_03790, partial [Desulfobacterales bacterium HSG16]|nr:hypothetical protein [Desulfobacterales bacterium HSG16]